MSATLGEDVKALKKLVLHNAVSILVSSLMVLGLSLSVLFSHMTIPQHYLNVPLLLLIFCCDILCCKLAHQLGGDILEIPYILLNVIFYTCLK